MRSRMHILLAVVLSFWATTRGWAEDCEGWAGGPLQQAGVYLNGANGAVNAMTSWDPDGAGPLAPVLLVAGDFTTMEGTAVGRIAYHDNTTGLWHRLGADFDDRINAIIFYNGQLIVGGDFRHIGGSAIQYIARWDGSTWQSMSNGLTGEVSSLAVYNGELHAGGWFYRSDDFPSCVARWTGSNWVPVGNGPTNYVTDIVAYQGSLYAGGEFSDTDDIPLCKFLARWDGNQWHAMDKQPDGYVWCLAVYNNELIVGGSFDHIGALSLLGLARYNGTTWSLLGSGLSSTPPYSTIAYATEVLNGKLYVGGYFEFAGGIEVNGAAVWDGATWQGMGQGMMRYPTNGGSVYTFTTFGGNIVAGGFFDSADDNPANNLARWDGTTWISYGGVGVNSINAMTSYNTRLIVAGDFFQPSPGSGPPHHIANWNGAELTPFEEGMNAPVNALATYTNPGVQGKLELVAGGSFTTAGEISAKHVARWIEDPTAAFPPPTWHAMGSGFSSDVNALNYFNGRYVAGGAFSLSGDLTTGLNFIAEWNAALSTWEQMGTGFNQPVLALRSYVSSASHIRLVAGGMFDNAGGQPTNYIASWTENDSVIGSASWLPMGQGFNDFVFAIEFYNGSLYAGGRFTMSGGSMVNHIARYNGTLWLPVGNGPGINGDVRSLKVINGQLYAGGDFTAVDGITTDNLARWDGTSWHEVDGGVHGSVRCIAPFRDEMHVGGQFEYVDSPIRDARDWGVYLFTGAPWIVHQPKSSIIPCKHDVTISLTYSGFSPGICEWRKNGEVVQTGPTGMGSTMFPFFWDLTIHHASDFDEGVYTCTITNACGSVVSDPVTLEVVGTCTPCPADFVSSATFDWPPDGVVDGADLAYLLGQWGRHPGPPYSGADIVTNRTFQYPQDGLVDGADLAVLLGAWGMCP